MNGAKGVLLNLVESGLPFLSLYHPLKVASPDGRVRPPLYDGKPLEEERFLAGEWRKVVVLDSPQSQANRLEEALFKLYKEKKIPLPLIRVEFPGDIEVNQFTAPHRIYDAIFRDSTTPDGAPFFSGELGKRLAKGDEKALFQWAPNVLIFGGWHSHAKESAEKVPRFPRLVMLEILGIEPRIVHRTSSKSDPLMLSGEVPEKLKETFPGKSDLSRVGYGTIPPGKDPVEVAVEGAVLVGSVSLIGLRRLSLPKPAKALLLALILLAVAEQDRNGYWLRSGTTLVPEKPLAWNTLERPGDPQMKTLMGPITDPESLIRAINELQEHVDEGLRWPREPLELKPADFLEKLFEESRPYI